MREFSLVAASLGTSALESRTTFFTGGAVGRRANDNYGEEGAGEGTRERKGATRTIEQRARKDMKYGRRKAKEEGEKRRESEWDGTEAFVAGRERDRNQFGLSHWFASPSQKIPSYLTYRARVW